MSYPPQYLYLTIFTVPSFGILSILSKGTDLNKDRDIKFSERNIIPHPHQPICWGNKMVA